MEATAGKDLGQSMSIVPETYNSVNLNDLDPSEARELQQHLEQQEQDRLAAEAKEVDTTPEQPALPSRPASRLSHAETEIFHDAVPASEMPPTCADGPAAVASEKAMENTSDLK